MLTDKDGRKINVHDESKVPNFTDEKIRFIDKIKNIEDNSVKELMISFLNGGKINCKPNYYDKKLEKLYDNVVRLYKIVPFIDKTKNGNSEG